MFYHTCIVICMGFATVLCAGDFPPGITICSANDPELNKCFMDTANKLIPHLKEDNARIGLLPLDRILIPNIGLKEGNRAVPTLIFNITNSNHTGFSDSRIIRAEVHPKKYMLEFTLFIPKYDIVGHYSVSGSIVSIPLHGNGMLQITTFNSTYNITLTGEPVNRGDKNFLQLKSFTLKADLERAIVNIDNLFGNKFLSDTASSLLNTAGRSLIVAGLPIVDSAFAEGYEGVLREMFNTVPYNRLFTDLE